MCTVTQIAIRFRFTSGETYLPPSLQLVRFKPRPSFFLQWCFFSLVSLFIIYISPSACSMLKQSRRSTMHNVNCNIEYKIKNAYIIHTPTQYSRFESFRFFLLTIIMKCTTYRIQQDFSLKHSLLSYCDAVFSKSSPLYSSLHNRYCIVHSHWTEGSLSTCSS